MQAVTGVFSSQSEAERAVRTLRSTGVSADKITLLTAGNGQNKPQSIPVDGTEQPGMGKAIGAVLGAAGGLSGGEREGLHAFRRRVRPGRSRQSAYWVEQF